MVVMKYFLVLFKMKKMIITENISKELYELKNQLKVCINLFVLSISCLMISKRVCVCVFLDKLFFTIKFTSIKARGRSVRLGS